MTTRALLAGLLLVLPLGAAAQYADDGGRSMLLEFRVAPYKPAIDEQFSTSPGPYETIFGADSNLMLQLVWEGHLINDAGSLTLGLSAGYWSAEGKSRNEDGSAGEDSTSIELYPLAAQLSYRLDQFAESFPLAPVVRLGFDYYLWRILDGDDEVALFAPGKEAQGGTYGWHASVGVHLLLDYFAPGMAMDFERDGGVYNSYITAEYIYAQIDEFGSASSIRLGDSTFFIGLALEL
ncbi:MAG: MXAN_2562 family outer membrane beta-barrel protein [bacterium]|nr:hypothetical protein [Myxococcales bacterium]MCB9543074.1 hypothetical protein [Myxococcales bacterium]MCB9551608.1 hypothetical protein [Myxococcales bacterium]